MEKIIDEYDDIIDTRNVLEQLERLQLDLKYVTDSDDREELVNEIKDLHDLIDQARTIGGDGPEDGIILVRDSHFRDYAEEFWEEIRESSERNISSRWPYTYIDWERAASDLRQDYTSITFRGVDYWGR